MGSDYPGSIAIIPFTGSGNLSSQHKNRCVLSFPHCNPPVSTPKLFAIYMRRINAQDFAVKTLCPYGKLRLFGSCFCKGSISSVKAFAENSPGFFLLTSAGRTGAIYLHRRSIFHPFLLCFFNRAVHCIHPLLRKIGCFRPSWNAKSTRPFLCAHFMNLKDNSSGSRRAFHPKGSAPIFPGRFFQYLLNPFP